MEAVAGGSGPVLNGGMIDVNGGWMGAGSTRMPEACFGQTRKAGAAC